jgi:hypothetical protein
LKSPHHQVKRQCTKFDDLDDRCLEIWLSASSLWLTYVFSERFWEIA